MWRYESYMYFHICPILQRLGGKMTANWRREVVKYRSNCGHQSLLLEKKNMNQNSGKTVRWFKWLILLEWLRLGKFVPFNDFMKVTLRHLQKFDHRGWGHVNIPCTCKQCWMLLILDVYMSWTCSHGDIEHTMLQVFHAGWDEKTGNRLKHEVPQNPAFS